MIFHNDESMLPEGKKEAEIEISVPDANGKAIEVGDEVLIRATVVSVVRTKAHLKESHKDTFRLAVQAGDVAIAIDSRSVEHA